MKHSSEELGSVFLGCLIHRYVSEILNANCKSLYSLAREGYVFEKLFNKMEGECGFKLSHHYLKVSRAMLFRICVADSETWQWSLKPKFSGSFTDLLTHRFGISGHFVAEQISEQDSKLELELPEQISIATELLTKYQNILMEEVLESKQAYLAYLNSIGFSEGATVLDIGYSGTIQKLLTHIMKVDTHGIYFIASNSGEHIIGEKTALMEGVFAENVEMGNGFLMLDRSIFLESLLTAPEGQLKDIRINPINGEFEFFYGKRANAQKHFSDLDAIFDGAIEHVVHCFKNDISYSKQEVINMFEQFVQKRAMFPQHTWKLFDIDDAISGNGNVDAFQLFGM